MAALTYLLWITTREGLRPETAAALVRRFGTAEAAYFADPGEYELLSLSERLCRSLADKSLERAERILGDCDRLGVTLLTYQDAAYPERLLQLHDFPLVLYVKGRLFRFDEELAVAIVGSRECTPYGVAMAGRLGLELARSGALVLSGLAQGIDAAALKGALQGGGPAVSVLAGGVDVVYPRRNQGLYEDVAAAGAILSENPPGTPQEGWRFPIRNRIRNLDIRFNNDSIIIDSLSYKAGHSDFLVKGIISNMRRSLTSRGFRSPLKVNFDILSDTVDVNELTYTSMLGSSYAVRRSRGESAFGADYDGSDEALDRRVAAAATASDDSIQPILVPVNIDARVDVSSRNVLYSDLDLKDMTGEILAYDGALNLHNLKATSDAGSVGLSALYAAPSADDIKFGFGLTVEKFNIERFERLIPAIDSIVPLLKDVAGIIDADVAATVDLTPRLDFKLPTLDAAVRITGDSLTIIDPETFKTMAKWLMFKDKQRNLIKHMSVSFLVEDNMLRVYPFIFDIDRYRLGVRGYNDLDFNFDYHVAVLKSPLPFKFGINIKGSPDKYKIRVGGAKFKADEAVDRPVVVDSARMNLIGQIEDIFRHGVSRSRFAGLNIGDRPSAATIDLATDTLTRADSLSLMREGLIPPDLTKDNTAY